VTIKRGTTGSGMTEKPTVSFDEDVDKTDPEIAAAMERSTLEGWIAAVERECFAVMAAEGLPTYHGSYLYDASGKWRASGPPLHGSIANEIWPIAKARGHSPDSEIGYAARMLGDVVWLRRAREKGNHERAALFASYLRAKEVERGIKREHEATWRSGKDTIDGARLGAERRASAFKQRHEAIRTDFQKRLSRIGNAQRAKSATAREFNISRRQLNRILAK